MIPPGLMIWAAQYGTKIIVILGLVLALIAGYYYWAHELYQSGYNEAVGKYEARDAKDAITAARIMASKKKAIADKAKKDNDILIGVLTHNDKQIKNLTAERDAALARSLRITTAKTDANSRNTLPGKASLLKSDDSGGQGTCEQELASDNKQKLIIAEYQIARLAELHLSCVAQIERTHVLK